MTASVSSVTINLVIVGLTALVTTACNQFVTRLQAASDRKREHYARAVETLVAWVEFPYRVRRRVDDLPMTLSALANLGHDLQEQLARDRAWIESENRRVAAVYAMVSAQVRILVGPAVSDAWRTAPASSAASMVLGEWGPSADATQWIEELQGAISWRFRWGHRLRRLPEAKREE